MTHRGTKVELVVHETEKKLITYCQDCGDTHEEDRPHEPAGAKVVPIMKKKMRA